MSTIVINIYFESDLHKSTKILFKLLKMPGDMAMWVLKDVFLSLKALSILAQTLCDSLGDRKLWQVAPEFASLYYGCR